MSEGSEGLPDSCEADSDVTERQSVPVCLRSLTFTLVTLYPQALSLSSHEAALQSYMLVLTVAIWHFLEQGQWVSVTNQPLGTGPQATDRWQLHAI